MVLDMPLFIQCSFPSRRTSGGIDGDGGVAGKVDVVTAMVAVGVVVVKVVVSVVRVVAVVDDVVEVVVSVVRVVAVVVVVVEVVVGVVVSIGFTTLNVVTAFTFLSTKSLILYYPSEGKPSYFR